MTGFEALTFYARLKARQGAVLDLWDRVGLAMSPATHPHTYSKGMRQAWTGPALLGHPRLLLLDEPTTVSTVLRRNFFGFVEDLNKAGTTVILSSTCLTELEMRTDASPFSGTPTSSPALPWSACAAGPGCRYACASRRHPARPNHWPAQPGRQPHHLVTAARSNSRSWPWSR
jgi:hypothetical protein